MYVPRILTVTCQKTYRFLFYKSGEEFSFGRLIKYLTGSVCSSHAIWIASIQIWSR